MAGSEILGIIDGLRRISIILGPKFFFYKFRIYFYIYIFENFKNFGRMFYLAWPGTALGNIKLLVVLKIL